MKTIIEYLRQQKSTIYSGIFFLFFLLEAFNTKAVNVTVFSISQLCDIAPDGSATAVPYGGVEPYTFLWSNGDTTSSIHFLAAGTYTVTVTDATGNAIIGSTTLNFYNDGIFITGISANASCPELNNGSVQATPMTGYPPYNYEWNTGDTGPALNGISPGTYSVTITDSMGCVGHAVYTVENTPVPPLYVDLNDPYCQDQTATFTAEAGYAHYVWELSNPADSIIQGQGTYAVTVKWGTNGPKNIQCAFNNSPQECTGTVIFNAAVVSCAAAAQTPDVFNQVRISPNPFTDFIGFESTEAIPANTDLYIRDVTGKTVVHRPMNDLSSTLELNQLTPGVYFLYLQAGSAVQTWRVLKQ